MPEAGPARAGRELSAARHPATAPEMEALYREFFRPLVRRARRRHRLSVEDARDVVQEAFVIALVKMDSEGNAEAWFRQVVDHLSVNLRRTVSRRADLLAQWMPTDGQAQARQCGDWEEEV